MRHVRRRVRRMPLAGWLWIVAAVLAAGTLAAHLT